MSSGHAALSLADERALVRQLAQQVLEVTAPEELVLFDDTAEEYFADPRHVLQPKGRDERVGSGVDMALLTPYILAVVTPVIELLVTMVGQAVKRERQESVNALVGRLFRRRGSVPSSREAHDPDPLSPEQLALVHQVALERGRLVGLPDARATLLADAIAGGIWATPTPSR